MKYFSIMTFLTLLFSTQAFGFEGCFEKNRLINNAVGSEFLPDKVCLDVMSFSLEGDIATLHIEEGTYLGSFRLVEITQPDSVRKFMAYIEDVPFEFRGQEMSATIRVSIDIDDDTKQIDYAYLAAEFFTFYDDGGYDVRILYFSRL